LNNVQLYIAVSIPSVLVILGWLSNNTRLAAVGERIDAVGSTLAGKMDRLEAKMDRRFDGVLDGIGSLRERVAVVESKQE
jgi:hypothetical protein